MFKDLDPLLHSQLRLAVMSLLMSVESAEFTLLKEKTNSTAGNLSVQLDKLSEAGYINVEKSFKGKKPLTTCKVTKKGIRAFEDYVNNNSVDTDTYFEKQFDGPPVFDSLPEPMKEPLSDVLPCPLATLSKEIVDWIQGIAKQMQVA